MDGEAVPHNFILNEIDYVVRHPEIRVLFAPSPSWHVHSGGGGGCKECHAFFDANWLQDGFEPHSNDFLLHHRHGNDICDLFAIANPSVMEQYTQVFAEAKMLNTQIIHAIDQRFIRDYEMIPDADNAADRRIVGAKSFNWNIEESPIFVPEKLIRHQMINTLVVHGETVMTISRR